MNGAGLYPSLSYYQGALCSIQQSFSLSRSTNVSCAAKEINHSRHLMNDAYCMDSGPEGVARVKL